MPHAPTTCLFRTVCQPTCAYEGKQYQLYEMWTSEKSCQRFRCVLPNETVTTLGFEAGLDINDLTTMAVQSKFTQIRGSANFK